MRANIRSIFGAEAAGLSAVPARFPRISASSQWQGGGCDAAMSCDGDPTTRWNAQDQQNTDQWLELDFGAPRTFEKATICEVFDRVTAHRLEYWDGQQWCVCAAGAEIGPNRAHTFAPVTATRVRLCMAQVRSDTPSIAEFAVLDTNGTNLAARSARITVNHNAQGGTAWFVENPTTSALRQVVDEALPLGDVTWQEPPVVVGGHVSYLHKVIDGRHVWFFTNSSDTPVSTTVELRGEYVLERWDPHTGHIAACPATASAGRTSIPLELAPVTSVFLVSGP